jgi:hypothetical protein
LKHTFNIKLEDTIHDMLYMYECVVIPDFGGFVSSYQSAQILSDKNLIVPPSKNLTFNALLIKNDGLLAQEIIAKHKVTYLEAIHIIDLEVDRWLAVLSSSKSVNIKGVGTIIKNKKGSLIFTQDLNTNLSNDSYGLGMIKAQVLKKEGISGKLKEEFVQRQASPVFNQKVRKIAAGGSMAAVFLVLFIWSYINLDLVQNRAESLSLFFSSEISNEASREKSEKDLSNDTDNIITSSKSAENNQIINSAESLSTELLHEIDSILSVEVEEETIVEETSTRQKAKIDNTEVAIENDASDDQYLNNGKYIIVAGCFRSYNNANNFVKELKSLGYDAQLAGHSAKGLHRVVYGSHNDRSDAVKSMRWIQSTHNAQAWMTTR